MAVTLRMTRLPFWPGVSHGLWTTIVTSMAPVFMMRRPVMQVARMPSDLRGYLLRVVVWRTVPLVSGRFSRIGSSPAGSVLWSSRWRWTHRRGRLAYGLDGSRAQIAIGGRRPWVWSWPTETSSGSPMTPTRSVLLAFEFAVSSTKLG
jgi:hypothetical protein